MTATEAPDDPSASAPPAGRLIVPVLTLGNFVGFLSALALGGYPAIGLGSFIFLIASVMSVW